MKHNEVYYCPSEPTKHTEFCADHRVNETWLMNSNGDYIEVVDSDVISGPHYICCAECGVEAVYGIPPSALELLAKEAE